MTVYAKDLLLRMVSEIENGHQNSFDDMELMVAPKFLYELENLGFVKVTVGVFTTVSVLPEGFKMAKK